MEKTAKNLKEDLELVQAIKTKKGREYEVAFNALYKKYNKQLIFRFAPMARAKEDIDVEEVVLQAFMKMNDNLEKYNHEDGAFSTWFYKLTQNLFIDKIRQKNTHSTIPISTVFVYQDEDSSANTFQIVSNEKTPEEKMVITERNKKIDEIINSIQNEEMKELIKLRYFDGCSYEEMSDILRKPLGSVKAHLHRAKDILREEFKKANISLD